MIPYPLLYIWGTSESQNFGSLIDEIILSTATSLVLGATSKVRRGQEHIAAKELREQDFFGLEKAQWNFYYCLQISSG